METDREAWIVKVRQNGRALRFASAELKADRGVVLAAVGQDGRALYYASAELKADRDVMLAAVGQYGRALEYASAELKADRGVVLAAVGQDGSALEYASAELKADRGVQAVHAVDAASQVSVVSNGHLTHYCFVWITVSTLYLTSCENEIRSRRKASTAMCRDGVIDQIVLHTMLINCSQNCTPTFTLTAHMHVKAKDMLPVMRARQRLTYAMCLRHDEFESHFQASLIANVKYAIHVLA